MIDIGNARAMVVISSPSLMIGVPCLCLGVKGSDYGLFRRCFGNNGSLSPICGLSVAWPILGLVEHLQSSFQWQELVEELTRKAQL
ncbi:hypothetical protein V6N13_037747 [Hibiscus sabdariffa]